MVRTSRWTPTALGLVAGLVSLTSLAAQTRVGDGPHPMARLGFGSAVAMAGDQLLVGRPGAVAGFPMPVVQAGAVHLFSARNGSWSEVGSFAGSGTGVGDGFGGSLAVAGEWLVVGAPGSDEGRGAAFVYQRAATGWTERARLVAATAGAGAGVGSAVAVVGDVILLGAPNDAGGTGKVHAFRRGADGTWVPAGTLSAEVAVGDRFGAALAFDGERVLVGAPGPTAGGFLGGGQPKEGAVFAYRRAGAEWNLEGRLAPASGEMRGFGSAILINGREAFVGSPFGNGMAGGLQVHARGDSGWGPGRVITPSSASGPAMFGSSIVRAGDDLAVGAPVSGGGAGAVHILRRGPDGTWSEGQKITVPMSGVGVGFGSAMAGAAGILAIGAPSDDFFEGKGRIYSRGAGGQWTETASIVDDTPYLQAITGGERRCEEGKVELFTCQDVDVVSFLPASAVGAKRGIMVNDLWGWTHAGSGREFVLIGRFDGTSFVEITDPANPVFLGDLPLHQGAHPNLWRDMKVYRDHAFIVSDGAGPHGMQVFDLTQLLSVTNAPATFAETAHYNGIASAHNIVIDEASGFAYAVGASMGGETCGGALHMIDIRSPTAPTFAGCFGDPATGTARTGYTHDAQCTVYHGPDTRYQGRQICFNASETAIGIADVTDKKNPKAISNASYPNVGYSHQGWLSDDHKYFYLNDELDELAGTVARTRTLVWDVTDLDDPVLLREFLGETAASDHNLYVKGRYMYQSNYAAGLRIIDVGDPTAPREVGHFDTVPLGNNSAGFTGSWSNYPYFPSGLIAVSSMREGLFILRHRPRAPIP